MPTDAARTALITLVQRACEFVRPSRLSPNRSRRGAALYDTERDESITEVPEFTGAAEALQADPDITAVYGADNARRLTIQFVYNTCGLVDEGLDVQGAFWCNLDRTRYGDFSARMAICRGCQPEQFFVRWRHSRLGSRSRNFPETITSRSRVPGWARTPTGSRPCALSSRRASSRISDFPSGR